MQRKKASQAKVDKNVKKALAFAKNLVGTPRGRPTKNSKVSPFFAVDGDIPAKKDMKKGMNCIGLTTLMRRYLGLPIEILRTKAHAKTGFYADSSDWINHLRKKKKLIKFDINGKYPAGTLLLRAFNPIDKGHNAVVYKANPRGVLFSSVIHSVGWNDGSGKTGVKIDHSVGKSHFAQYNGTTNKGHYQYACLPADWLV